VVSATFSFAAILCSERFVALFCHSPILVLIAGLVDALDLVVHVHVDVDAIAERKRANGPVQLRVAFHGLVLDPTAAISRSSARGLLFSSENCGPCVLG